MSDPIGAALDIDALRLVVVFEAVLLRLAFLDVLDALVLRPRALALLRAFDVGRLVDLAITIPLPLEPFGLSRAKVVFGDTGVKARGGFSAAQSSQAAELSMRPSCTAWHATPSSSGGTSRRQRS